MSHRLIRCVLGLLLVGAAASPPATEASGKGEGAGTIESRVREVNTLHRYLYLEDGTMLLANDPRQIERIAPGARVRAAYEERAGRKFINRLEIVQ